MLHRRVVLFVAASFLMAGDAAALDASPAPIESIVVETPDRTIILSVEIASDPDTRERGLMFRHRLAEDRGMLFQYETPHRISMWMKNTFIPLDMIFIRSDGSVSEVVPDTTPRSLAVIQATERVVGVLEVAAGTSARLGIKPGARIKHPFFGSGD
ncbi:MAG: DUF192 domain-containing protein [Pseudomonadota bacterium]|nr:DUF192 domain-containing protein [Pseudomonadota bacterium]